MLQRALKSLPKRKHIETIVKFAILEFKFGDKERGVCLYHHHRHGLIMPSPYGV